MKYDYLIIGGGIAGVTAAETIRERDERGTILVIGEEPHLLYSRVLLPHYVKGKISRDKLFLRTESDFEKKRIDLRLATRAVSVEPENKNIITDKGEVIGYGKLVIASGGRVREWAVKGAGKKNIFYFQTIDDADAIKKALGGIKKAVVVGGGFIAFELTEIFIEAKIPTTILCRSGSFFGKSLDREGNEIIRKRLLELGVNVIFGEAESVLGSEYVEGIHLKNGEKIFCDAIGLGIGLERNIEFLDGSGIETGKGIMTNEFLETRAPDIFAIGDIAEYLDVIMGKRIIAGNWTSAFLQGRNAGFAATGEKKVFSAVPSYSISVFGLNIDSIGDIGEPEAITHFDKVKNKYARFFISKGILVGAVIINNPQLKQKIFKLITEKSDFRSFEDKIFLG